MPNNLKESYETFKLAYEKLREFIDTDNKSEKDRAAIIHAYEYTFELWWKSLQRYLQDYETVEECGPGATIRNAFQFGIIDDGQDYMDMLRDRNLIAHTYKENIAIEIHDRIVTIHINTLERFIKEFDKKIL
jgi:nucleotidyltransferase substrate binding protein (TIGR01987 family)